MKTVNIDNLKNKMTLKELNLLKELCLFIEARDLKGFTRFLNNNKITPLIANAINTKYNCELLIVA